MLVQRPVSSAAYLKICSNFHYVMEILQRETTPLSLVVEDSGAGNSLSVGTPSASTPSASASASQNTAPVAATSSSISSLQDLDPAQLESRIGFAKSLLWQLKKFEDRTPVFDVMHAISVSFEEAYKVVQDNEIYGTNMEDLLLNASIQHQQKQQQLDQQKQNHHQQLLMSSDTSSTSSSPSSPPIHLIDLRASLCLRLRLLVPLLPVVLHQPEATTCDLGTLVVRLTNLLVSSLVHGHGSEERLFEFCLDMASCLMDEVLLLSGGQDLQVNKDRRIDVLNRLRAGLPQMTTTIPTVFSSRIFRILPFQQHNVYFTSLSVAGDNPSSKQGSSAPANTSKEIQPRPWDWLEDCIGDVDGTQNTLQQPQSTPNLGLGLAVMDAGGLSNGQDGSGSLPGAAAASSPYSGPSAGTSENLNDTSISLTFFGAKQIRKAEGTTYQTQFKLGHGGGDDEQELILVDQQHRPSHYNHSQQLLLQQQQLLRQQQQQEFESAAIAAASRAMDTPGSMFDNNGSSNSMMDMDVNLSVNSSVGGPPSSQNRPPSSLSAPTLQAQQEPDPELEEGQILGDDDLDMASMSWANNGQVAQNSVVAPNSTSSSTSSASVPLMQQQQQQQLQGLATQIEDGELIEPMIISGSLSSQNSIKSDIDFGSLPTTSAAIVAPVVISTGQFSGISTPTTLATSIAIPSPTLVSTAAIVVPTASAASAASKKRGGAAGAKATRGVAAVTKATRGGGKGSRGGKAGAKVIAVASSAPVSSSATVSVPTTMMETASISVPPSTLPTSVPVTSMPVSVPPVQQSQSQQPQQPQQQQQPFQVQPPMMHIQMPPSSMTLQQFHQQQQQFQQQFRPQGTMQPNLMSIALPGQPQPQPMMPGNGANGALTAQQLMVMMRQSQAASGAGGVGSIIGGMGGIGGIGPGGNHMVTSFPGGAGGAMASTMIGGIHVPMINNGQPQFQPNQPQQQNNFMDPSVFLNNNNNNSNNANNMNHFQQQHHQQQQQFQQPQQGQQGQDGGNNMW